MTIASTPGQTVGPFFGHALPFADGNRLVPPSHPRAVRLGGRVLDGAGHPVPDALLELWQTDEYGAVPREQGSLHRDGYTFTGWGRTATDDAGCYAFTTVVPGMPFWSLTVFARGLLNRLFTRIYLPDASDPLLTSLPENRRQTLVAAHDDHGYSFDVVLQGENETVFLTYPKHARHG